ncbi:MAG TPA: divergent PAP2 family protein [Candidatus Krumholzibacteriaceae bacterium]|nr:divergent PAP2 family protein [Candidatus Krumholzibacteriaceae bacterium]
MFINMIKVHLYRYIFLIPILVGFIVQNLKVLIYSLVNMRIDYGRILDANGMPNLHSAVFSSLSMSIGIKYGFSTLLFSVVTVYSIIIMHDTIRLKREKEKQTNIINIIIANVNEFKNIREGKIKKVLQIRIFDIAIGALLGVLITYLLIY